jgi:hypothetical protein
MPDNQEVKDLKNAYRLHTRAQTVSKNYESSVIARFETIWLSTEPDRPQRKRVTVQPKTTTFMYSLRHTKPRALSPGR